MSKISIFLKSFYLYFTLLLMLTEILRSLKNDFLVKITQNY